MNTGRLLAIAACAIGLGSTGALGAYPEKPLKIIVPYSAGGAADTTARLIGQKLADRLKQPVVVENKPGASGTIGAASVATAPADGYTLLLDATGHTTNPSLFAKLPYDTAKDFVPISLVTRIPALLVVPASSPFKSVQDVVKAAREKPGKLTYASAGNGGAQHLAGELFSQAQKLEMIHVPYKGGAPALTDLIGGQVDMMFSAVSASGPHVKGGRLRALATTGVKPTAGFTELPTVAASGVPGFEVYEWNGLFAPKGTPAAVVERLEKEVRAIVAQPDVQQRLAELGAEPVGSSAADFAAFLKSETAKWSKVIKDGNIRAE
jgi:tripartite-type tricarboxylate transporter receptor subunit TctC